MDERSLLTAGPEMIQLSEDFLAPTSMTNTDAPAYDMFAPEEISEGGDASRFEEKSDV